MDWGQVSILIVAFVALGIAIYNLAQGKKPVSLEGVVTAVEEAIPIGQDFAKVAEIAVNAVEQLKREGKIATNDQAFNMAIDIAEKYLPGLDAIGNEKLIMAINAAVLVASSLTAQIEHAKADMGMSSSQSITTRGPKQVSKP